jgi:hypothetical protein
MSDTAKWILAIVVAVLVIGLVAYARGNDHFRGDDEGALGQLAYASHVVTG